MQSADIHGFSTDPCRLLAAIYARIHIIAYARRVYVISGKQWSFYLEYRGVMEEVKTYEIGTYAQACNVFFALMHMRA